ncbi:hypothetical protein LUZ62_016092 [Rhynchospora pubera]|uniref:Uncharacterized protein n=1 Tax=Rhynchospora pubera TaxID=906938 RepID=A0AAV8GI30_9POAL|nr:hypothetical protein LUZ62_016092 [Rhynchospora pubera]
MNTLGDHLEEPITPRSLPPVGERRPRYRDVAQALRCGLREVAADFSFLRLKGLRSILKTLQSVAASDAATRLFRLSQASRELQVVPVLFENSFRKMKDDSDVSEPELGGEPIKLKRPATNSEVALALRVLEGCCLLCKDCADTAYRYDAIKVLLNILLTRGVLEQKACLDALVALLISSAANEMDFKELQGVSKASELIIDMRRDTSVRIKCAEFLLLITGNAYEKGETHMLPKIYEDIKQGLGENCTMLIQAANRFASSLDPRKRQDALTAQARCIVEIISNRT